MEQLDQLVTKLENAFSGRLVSAVLYGSAAAGDYHGPYSDLNVLCVLKDITPRELAEGEPIFRWWRSLGNPSPLLMTEEEVFRSADSFPIEFHDMKERRRVLHGLDIIAELTVSPANHRTQVEHELRAKLFHLRQRGAGVLSNEPALLSLCVDSVSTFLVLARHLLLVAKREAPSAKRDIVAAIARFGIDPQPFTTLLDIRERLREPGGIEALELFTRYLESIRAMTALVDKLETL
jgi:predicted nucleotidyltransferase